MFYEKINLFSASYCFFILDFVVYDVVGISHLKLEIELRRSRRHVLVEIVRNIGLHMSVSGLHACLNLFRPDLKSKRT